MLKLQKALEAHLQNATQCANELNIIVSALRDLEIENLSNELQAIKNTLSDSLWDLETKLIKLEE